MRTSSLGSISEYDLTIVSMMVMMMMVLAMVLMMALMMMLTNI